MEKENPDDIYTAVKDVYENFYAPESKKVEVEEEVNEYAIFPEEELIEDELKSFSQAKKFFQGRNTEHLLSWWKSNFKIYPNLSKMARDYLAIPATSAASERLFSSGKHLITDYRNSLCPETIQACQCLKSWIKP